MENVINEELALDVVLGKEYDEKFIVYLELLEYDCGNSPYYIDYKVEDASPLTDREINRYFGINDTSF